jgi:aspartate racemase
LGLIGGLGVGATIHYYKELVKEHGARGRVPDLLMVHADVNRVLRDAAAGDTRQLAAYLAELLERLSSAGARVAAIPAVTPHICIAELVEISPIPLVSLPAAILREIQIRQLKRVALFGTRFTMETRMFGQLAGVEVVVPRADEVDLIHEAYVQIVNAGCGTEEQYQGLGAIAHALCEREGVEAVVLAGTELSLIFNETNTDFPHINGARVHLAAIMRDLFAETA